MTREWHPRALAQITLRSLQFVFACISAALYAVDLANWSSASKHANASWIYAEVVSVLAVFTCVAQWWLALRPLASCPWDSLLFLLWLVAVAVFGQFLSGNDEPEGGFSKGRIGAAVGIDALNMVLWLMSAVEACMCCGATREVKRQKKVQPSQKERDFAMEEVKVADENPPSYDEAV
ncbi:hypothetical protein B0T10DRAFT_301694 [Thelonectria olida]|uniref:MARVEL domain-containing protein n=1 Tax=Thelonectria olida TaxID=1576542 RepID=A0A9P9AMY0_9HYPO|nr:hypothetical protein B0T10DRAFT_301694 [Thelonectria olida]